MDSEKLHFDSIYDNINLVEKFIVDICEKYKIEEDNFGNILLAVTEAVNNAIQHGNNLDPKKKINLAYESNNKNLSFTIADEGKGFDYNTLPDPTEPNNIEKPNGRGVFLMRHLADTVDFIDNGRIVKLNFNIAS
jgi:serine/threonine-protein kinase RsbW